MNEPVKLTGQGLPVNKHGKPILAEGVKTSSNEATLGQIPADEQNAPVAPSRNTAEPGSTAPKVKAKAATSKATKATAPAKTATKPTTKKTKR